jgi:hypothetical protein
MHTLSVLKSHFRVNSPTSIMAAIIADILSPGRVPRPRAGLQSTAANRPKSISVPVAAWAAETRDLAAGRSGIKLASSLISDDQRPGPVGIKLFLSHPDL